MHKRSHVPARRDTIKDIRGLRNFYLEKNEAPRSFTGRASGAKAVPKLTIAETHYNA